MINTAQDLESAIAFIAEEQTSFSRQLNNEISVNEYNSIFMTLEEQINNLYEKIRTLEDIKNYTKEFVVRAIEERRQKFINSLKVIEMKIDKYNEKDCVDIVIPFDNCNEQLYDRNGDDIQNLVLIEGNLTLNSTTLHSVKINRIENRGQFKQLPTAIIIDSSTEIVDINQKFTVTESFEDIHTQINGQQGYYTISETELPNDGILSIYDIYLDNEEVDSNYCHISPLNCEIQEIQLIDPYDQVIVLPQYETYFEPVCVSRISVKVKAVNNDKVQLSIPTDIEQDAFTCVYRAV